MGISTMGVITNGTAVLGLGNIGPLASKPVMEGKAVLFKKFAGIDYSILRLMKPIPRSWLRLLLLLNLLLAALTWKILRRPIDRKSTV